MRIDTAVLGPWKHERNWQIEHAREQNDKGAIKLSRKLSSLASCPQPAKRHEVDLPRYGARRLRAHPGNLGKVDLRRAAHVSAGARKRSTVAARTLQIACNDCLAPPSPSSSLITSAPPGRRTPDSDGGGSRGSPSSSLPEAAPLGPSASSMAASASTAERVASSEEEPVVEGHISDSTVVKPCSRSARSAAGVSSSASPQIARTRASQWSVGTTTS